MVEMTTKMYGMTPFLFFLYNMKQCRIGQKTQISALTTQKASQNAPNVKGCPKLLSSVDFGHFLTFWLVANWGALGMEKKCVIFYLGRVPSYFFHFKSLSFRT
jgi:hypothetical protein